MSLPGRLVTMTAVLVTAFLVLLAGGFAPADAAMKKPISVYPQPKTPVASNATTFSFRGIKKKNLGPVVVIGKKSGRVKGRLLAHSDGKGVSFIPNRRFQNGEQVHVRTKRWILGANNKFRKQGRFWVRIGRFYGNDAVGNPQGLPRDPGTLKSRPDLAPTVVDVKTVTPEVAPGKIVFTTMSGGLNMMDEQGRHVWFRPLQVGGPGTSITDIKVAKYRGKPVITYFKAADSAQGFTQLGWYEVLNEKYNRIARVKPGNGYGPDLHEFLITKNNTALVLSYRGVKWNATKAGGTKDTKILDNVVQEVDIKTGAVLFEWHALGNVGIMESQRPVPDEGPWDYFHVNSAELDGPNGLLISARGTSSLYRLRRNNSTVAWAMRGMAHNGRSSFQMGPGTGFGYQHDARRLPNGDISLFDNGAAAGYPTANEASAGMIVRIEGEGNNRSVELVKRYEHPDGVFSGPMGSAQVLPNGNMFVGWGGLSQMTEFNAAGDVTFDAQFWRPAANPFDGVPNAQESSYRSHKFQWNGIAQGVPAVASEIVDAGEPGEKMTVWASWNGATNIAKWRVLTGADENSLAEAVTVDWDNLETEIEVPGVAAAKFQVEALDEGGNVLAKSAVRDAGFAPQP